MLPPGLEYVESWVEERRLDRCFQLMETEDPSLFDRWTAEWSDLVEFEIVPVVSSVEASGRVGPPEMSRPEDALRSLDDSANSGMEPRDEE
jgi:hypothetical protein